MGVKELNSIQKNKELTPDSLEFQYLDQNSKKKLLILPALIGLAVVIFTIFLWLEMVLEEEVNLSHRIGLRTENIKSEILSEVESQILALKRMTLRWGFQGQPRQEEWVNDMNLHLSDYPVYQALGWVDQTFHVRWIVPLKGNEKAVNLDLSFEEKRRRTLLGIKKNKVLGITPPITLAQGGRGFIIYVPIYFENDFGGLISGVFRMKKLFDFILTQEILEGVSIAIYNGEEEIYRRSSTPAIDQSRFLQKAILNFHNVNWRLEVWPDPEFYSKNRTYNSKVALFLGIFMALIISFTIYFAQKEKLRAKQIELARSKLEIEIEKRTQAEKKMLSAKLEAEHANRAKSLFLANMSHEIRTPMNAILGYSQILLRKKSLDGDIKGAIKTIDNSGKNLLDLINEVLDISKIEAGKMEIHLADFDLKVLIDNLSSLFELRCKQKQLQWVVKGFSNPVFVQGDETKLRQILVNLLGNAIKFTDSGRVLFTVTAVEKYQYCFNIIDTGSGIPVEALDKIFDAFEQNKGGAEKGGTGLGLAIAQKQLQLMGSDLFVESKIDEGSDFHFTLSLPPSKNEIKGHNVKTDSILHLAPGYQVKTLVVDDVKENRDVLSKLLADIGVEIMEASNGKEGVEKTSAHVPDIVFMDMRMPVMRGEDALKLIQKEFGQDRVKIVAITASALDRRREYYLEMGFHEYISKPFREEEVFNCLNNLLDVEFVYDDNEVSQEELNSKEGIDFSRFSIPEDLYKKMKKSAEMSGITELERMIEALQKNNVSEQLIEVLMHSLQKFEMEEILEILERVTKTKD
jgi:signal transduction histidine kinase/DNA-binding response OmpR family regulator